MKRATAFAAVLAIFLLGIAAGLLGGHLFYARLLARPGGPPELGSRHFARHLERALELSDEQKVEIEQVLADTRETSQKFRREMEPRVRELLESTRDEIEKVLTPEQLEKFEELRKKLHRRMEQFLLGPPGGGRDRKGGWRPPPPPFEKPDHREPERDED